MKHLKRQYFIIKLNINKISIHIDVEFYNSILIPCIIKIPSKYLFYVNYLLYAFFKILMILCDFIISVSTIPWFIVVFTVGTNFSVREFRLHFPTMAPGKASVRAARSTWRGAGTQYDRRRGRCLGPWGPFCKLQNVPYLEW